MHISFKTRTINKRYATAVTAAPSDFSSFVFIIRP